MAGLDLNSDEKIIIKTRRHWAFVVFGLIKFGFLALLPFAVYVFFYSQQPSFLADYSQPIWSAIWLYLFGLSVFLVKFWIDYYLNVWIVTSQRIFDIELKGLFDYEIAVFSLNNVQDVTVSIRGPFATLLDYGDVLIQTAGENMTFVFCQIAAPQKIQEQIVELSRRIRQASPDNPA